ncbi:hypothetical protein RJ55_02602 [Drechmeria coniospora]|nr:hypothetical protein RJ55_02602 [Drechmeria coniospora]
MPSTLAGAGNWSASAAFASNGNGASAAFGFGGAGDGSVTSKKERRKKRNEPKVGGNSGNSGNGDNEEDNRRRKGDKHGLQGPNSMKRRADGHGSIQNSDPAQSNDAYEVDDLPDSLVFGGSYNLSSSTTASFHDQSRASDEYAEKIHNQLSADGIHPPAWPPNPGAPSSKQAMARFRETYEAYRSKARASLTRAGLIDDPNKRKRLSEAIPFKGICDEKCPQYEMIQRITEADVPSAERDKNGEDARLEYMVKKLARSAAGQEAPLPMDVRSTRALGVSLNYLFRHVLRDESNLRKVHGFVWDRTRAIRRDFAFFSSMLKAETITQVYVLENIARFHVASLHLLPRQKQAGESIEDVFSEHQELEQLGKTLLSLRDVYDDCNEQNIQCDNEAEFRAYYLLFHGRDPAIVETLQLQWNDRLWEESEEVRIALTLVEVLHNSQDFIGSSKHREDGPLLAAASAYSSFFDIVHSVAVSYTMACFAECHFPHIRRAILQSIKRAMWKPKPPMQDITAEILNGFLRYDTVDEAIEFAEKHGFEFSRSGSPSQWTIILKDRLPVPFVKIDHQFSQELVEKKRGNWPLHEVLHRTVFERVGSSEYAPARQDESSLFVASDDESTQQMQQQKNAAVGPGLETVAKSAFGDAAGSHQKPRTMAPFVLESDPESDADLPKVPTRPETVTNNAVWGAPRFGQSGMPSDGAQAKQNPFGTIIKLPDMQQGLKQDGTAPIKPNPFATGSESKATVSASAGSRNPFATFAAQKLGGLFSSDTNQGSLAPTKPNPFAPSSANSVSSLFGNKTTHQASVDSNPFSGFGTLGNSGRTASDKIMPSILAQSSQKSPTTPFPASLGKPVLAGDAFSTAHLPSAAGGVTLNSGPQVPTEVIKASRQASLTNLGAQSSPPFIPALPSTSAPQRVDKQDNIPSVLTCHKVLQTKVYFHSLPLPLRPPGTLQRRKEFRSRQPLPLGEKVKTSSPRRDLLGDFNRWFVMGDEGLLSEFLIESVTTITRDAFEQYEVEVEEKTRLEEIAKTNAEVEKFRVYNLSLKFFYRWKRNAREKRLRQVRRQGRDEMRAFYAARSAAESKARKETQEAEKDCKVGTGSSASVRSEFLSMIRSKKKAKDDAAESLLASGILSGLNGEREAVQAIVDGDFLPSGNARPASSVVLGLGRTRGSTQAAINGDGMPSIREQSTSRLSLDSSPGSTKREGPKTRVLRELLFSQPGKSTTAGFEKKEGAKTRALRRMLFGQTDTLRRSLPLLPSGSGNAPETQKRVSNLSSRWKLKAMGIVPLADGTAVPESLAHEMWPSPAPRYPRSVSPWRRRRLSATDAIEAEVRRLSPIRAIRERFRGVPGGSALAPGKRKRYLDDDGIAKSGSVEGDPNKRVISDSSTSRLAGNIETSPTNKRKRSIDEEERVTMDEGISHKRILSDAAKVRLELKALQAELEEGAEWYRSQTGRFRSESEGRGASLFDESM